MVSQPTRSPCSEATIWLRTERLCKTTLRSRTVSRLPAPGQQTRYLGSRLSDQASRLPWTIVGSRPHRLSQEQYLPPETPAARAGVSRTLQRPSRPLPGYPVEGQLHRKAYCEAIPEKGGVRLRVHHSSERVVQTLGHSRHGQVGHLLMIEFVRVAVCYSDQSLKLFHQDVVCVIRVESPLELLR